MMSRWQVLFFAALTLMLSTTMALASDLHVPADYATIQAAIDASDPGDTIIVAPGWHYGRFTVPSTKQNLTIRGDGSGRVYVREGFLVYADGVHLRDLECVYGTYGVYARDVSCSLTNVICWYQNYGVYAYGAAMSLNNVRCYYNTSLGMFARDAGGSLTIWAGRVYRCDGTGVYVRYGATATLSGMRVDNNSRGMYVGESSATISGCGFLSNAYYGVTSASGSSVTCTNTEIAGSDWGLTVYPGSSADISDCNIHDNPNWGVAVHGSLTAENCTVTNNGYDGLAYASSSASADLTGCEFSYNGFAGVVVGWPGASITLTDCAMNHNGRYGLYLGKETSASLSGCALKSNEYDGASVYGTLTAEGCLLTANTYYGVRALSGSSVDLTDCNLTNNYIGVGAFGTASATNCYMNLNDRYGARAMPGGNLNIEGGEVKENGEAGLHYVRDAGGTVTGVKIASNLGHGVHIEGASPTIEGNVFYRNWNRGVEIVNYPGAAFHGGGLVFDPTWAADDIVAEPTITGNTFTANQSIAISSVDARTTNLLTLDTDNTFYGSTYRVVVRWYGMVRVMYAGSPVEGAEVYFAVAGNTTTVPRITNAEGYIPTEADYHDADTWFAPAQYWVAYNGLRSDFNPWHAEAFADGGNLRGSATYCYDGEPKSEGFDIDGRYQIMYVELNARPIADAGEDRTVEANAIGGADVTLDASGCSDPDGDELTFTWKEGDTVLAGPTTSMTCEVFLALGEHTITLVVDDGQDDPVSDQCVITVVDTTPPTFILDVLKSVLWPPEHMMMKAAEVHSLSDICDPNPSMTITVTSNEPIDGTGDGSTEPDWEVVQNGSVWEIWLRAERCGSSVSRVYTIEAVAADASGNTSTQTATVTVPHDQS